PPLPPVDGPTAEPQPAARARPPARAASPAGQAQRQAARPAPMADPPRAVREAGNAPASRVSVVTAQRVPVSPSAVAAVPRPSAAAGAPAMTSARREAPIATLPPLPARAAGPPDWDRESALDVL